MSSDSKRLEILKKLTNNNVSLTNDELKTEITSLLNEYSFFPVGSIILFSSNKIPDGWLKCDGSTLSTIYCTKLFSVINTLYGGDGLTTFKLPNMNGRIPIGTSENYLIGRIGGEEKHTLTTDELPKFNLEGSTNISGNHNHTGYTSVSGEHNHDVKDYGLIHKNMLETNTASTIKLDMGAGYPDLLTSPLNLSQLNAGSHNHIINEDGNHNHTFVTESIGSNQPHNIMQPYIVLNYIIKFK